MTGAVLEGRSQVFRTRVARLRAAHSYRLVLVLVLVAFAFAAIAGDATWTTGVLLVLVAATLAAAAWTSGLVRPDSKALIVLLAGVTVLAGAVIVDGGNGLVGAAGILSGVLVVATIAAISIGVIDQNEVNAQSVTGAICIYLLFGIMFLFLYGAIAVLGSDNFFAQGTDGTRSLRLYFSFVTLATLGYGDYTAGGELARLLAVIEALIGQLYLVTVIALLVSQLRSGRRS
jgi:hypothetical protein